MHIGNLSCGTSRRFVCFQVKKYLPLLIFILISFCGVNTPSLSAKDQQQSPPQKLFEISIEKTSLRGDIMLTLDPKALRDIAGQKSRQINFLLPTPDAKQSMVELSPYPLLTEEFVIKDATDKIVLRDPSFAKAYIDKSVNKHLSRTTMVIFDDRVYLSYQINNERYSIEPVTNLIKTNTYRLKKSIEQEIIECHTREVPLVESPYPYIDTDKSVKTNNNIVTVYIECDHKMFQDNGSNINNTSQMAANLMANVAEIYANEVNVNLQISEIKVWTTPDPYDAANKTFSIDVLYAFNCHLSETVYNGRLAHLFSTVSKGHGGIADIRQTCVNQAPMYAYSNISNNPSASRILVAHEIGHNLSSPHTHACAWNGNNTQLDDCGNPSFEGNSCYNSNNRIIPQYGTMMSYCGNFNNTDIVHPLVEVKIRNYVQDCLRPIESSCPAPTPSSLTVTMDRTGTKATVVIDKSPNDFFFLQYRLDNTWLGCFCNASSTTNTFVLENLTPNQNYSISAAIYCSNVGANSEWSCFTPFLSAPNLCDQPITLMGTPSGSYSNKGIVNLDNATTNNTLAINYQFNVNFIGPVTINMGSVLTINQQDCN